jgi:hypothetical protein
MALFGTLRRFLVEPGSFWLWVRVALVCVGGIFGALPAVAETLSSGPPVAGYAGADSLLEVLPICAAALVFMPVSMFILVSLPAAIPPLRETWRRPSWRINPLLPWEPLQFFHLGACFLLAQGAGALLSLPLAALPSGPLALRSIVPYGAVSLCVGVGVWAGVLLCTRVYVSSVEH